MITLQEEPEIIYDIMNDFTTESFVINGSNFIFNLNENAFKVPVFKLKIIKDSEEKIQELFLIFELILTKDVLNIATVTGIEAELKLKLEKEYKSFLLQKKMHRVSLVLRMRAETLVDYIQANEESENKTETIFDINDEIGNSIVLNFKNYEILEVLF